MNSKNVIVEIDEELFFEDIEKLFTEKVFIQVTNHLTGRKEIYNTRQICSIKRVYKNKGEENN